MTMEPRQSKPEPTVSADEGHTRVTVLTDRDGAVLLAIDWGNDSRLVRLAPGAAAYLAGVLAIKAGVEFGSSRWIGEPE
jgi:hypothetical protein